MRDYSELLNNKKPAELISMYGQILRELRNKGVIRTNNLVGEFGEYISIDYYNKTPGLPRLIPAPIGAKNVDALSSQGERYSIKATTTKTTGAFRDLSDPTNDEIDKQKFEYVIIVKFNKNIELEKIIELEWELFLKHKKWHKTVKAWNLSMNRKLLDDAKILYDSSK